MRRIGVIWIALLALACLSCKSGNGPDDPKDLEITYPRGGETFTVGQKVTITWKASDKIVSVFFKLSTHPDSGWTQAIKLQSIPAENGSWDWTIGAEEWPARPPYPSSLCRIKILDYETLGSTYADSCAAFTVN